MNNLTYGGRRLDAVLGRWLVTAAFNSFDKFWDEVFNLRIEERGGKPILAFEFEPVRKAGPKKIINFISAIEKASDWTDKPLASRVQIKMWKNMAEQRLLPNFHVQGPGSFQYLNKEKDLKECYASALEMYERVLVRFVDIVGYRVFQILLRESWIEGSPDFREVDSLHVKKLDLYLYQVMEDRDRLTRKAENELSVRNNIPEFRNDLIKVLKGSHSMVNLMLQARCRTIPDTPIVRALHKKAVCYKLGEKDDFDSHKQEMIYQLSCEIAEEIEKRKNARSNMAA